jgi:LuxR family transcriptional regulator, maltose regulon positive regulatory protein
VVERLLSELATLEKPVVLVIDDLHELRSPEALACLELFLARMPSRLLVVMATREDPRLGLHRLRLAGELTELRGSDLAFSIAETRELLAASGIELSEGGVALLHERTEGWAAGLRLAAISLGEHPDPERFVREFSGSERTVAGYLLAEVLERQPADVRELLLRTSVLERVSGPLADYLTGGSGAERILQELADANAFVAALDAGRAWFRYHQLFADLLQLELRRVSPATVRPLHRAAADWYEQEGYVVEAIRHAQAARDWSLASRLLAGNWFDLALDGRTRTVAELVRVFPDDVAASDAEVALVFSAVRLFNGQHAESAAYIDLAQRLAEEVPVDRPWFDAQLAIMKLVVARWHGDLDAVLGTMRSVEAALSAQPAGAPSDEIRSVALQNLGVAELWASRFADARDHLEQALALARRAGRPSLQVSDLSHLAIAGVCTGRSFSEGLELSEEAVRIADAKGSCEPGLVSGLAAGAIARLWLGRFDEAEQWLERAGRALEPSCWPTTELVVHHGRGLLRLVQGRFAEALAAFRAAEEMQARLVGMHAFAVRVRGRLVQTLVHMGELEAAQAALYDLTEEQRDTPALRIAQAAISLAASDPGRMLDVLAPVIDGALPSLHHASATVEAYALNAVAHEHLGNSRAAEASLERALELAEPEGLVLAFVLVPVRNLVERLPRHRTTHATLLRTILDVLGGGSAAPTCGPAYLLEDLSEAELRVVRYLPSNLKAPEIAAELCVSANTVRTHIRHIYGKLDAHDRSGAVGRARALGLLARSR